MKETKIFPEVKNTKSYVERNYAIMVHLRNNNNFLYKYVNTWGEAEKNLRNYYGVPYPIKPMEKYLDYFPFAVTEQGGIICMPKFDVCPSMAIYGSKRTGKSTCMHRIVEYFYWWMNYMVFLGNDYQNECYAWANPCKSTEFYRRIITFGEKPAPLPIFLVFPNSKKDMGMKKLKTPKITIKFPIKYLVEHIEEFVNLDKTEEYFKNIHFEGCKSQEEIKNRIIKSLEEQGVRPKIIASMLPKINNMMNLFFEEGMLSFNEFVVDNLKLDNDGSIEAPIVQFLKVGVIPTLITTQIKSKEWFPNYFKRAFNQIIEYKQEDRNFKARNLLIVVDEMNKILVDKKVIDTIGTSIAQGGMLNIAFLGAAHHPSEIHTIISGNCKTMFCFNMVSDLDIKRIKKDYNLDKKQAKLIGELGKFEFIAKSKEFSFVVYDLKNNKTYETDFVHGFVIPPISHHLPPSSSVKNFFASGERFGGLYGGADTTNYAKKILIENKIILRNTNNGDVLNASRRAPDKFFSFKIKKPKIIEGVDYSRAYWRKKLNSNSRIIEVEYDFLINSGIMIYKKDKRYFLCYVKEAEDDFLPQKVVPDGMIIQYNPFFEQFRLLAERSSLEWYPKKESLGWNK